MCFRALPWCKFKSQVHHCSYFFVGFAKRLGPEMPYYLTITKSELPIDGTTSTLSAKKENVPYQEKYLLLSILCLYKTSDGLNAMVRGKPCPKVNRDSSDM